MAPGNTHCNCRKGVRTSPAKEIRRPDNGIGTENAHQTDIDCFLDNQHDVRQYIHEPAVEEKLTMLTLRYYKIMSTNATNKGLHLDRFDQYIYTPPLVAFSLLSGPRNKYGPSLDHEEKPHSSGRDPLDMDILTSVPPCAPES